MEHNDDSDVFETHAGMLELEYLQLTSGTLAHFSGTAYNVASRKWEPIHGIFDKGSGNSYISQRAADMITPEIIGKRNVKVTGFGGTVVAEGLSDVVMVKVKGHDKKIVDEIFIVRDRLQSMAT